MKQTPPEAFLKLSGAQIVYRLQRAAGDERLHVDEALRLIGLTIDALQRGHAARLKLFEALRTHRARGVDLIGVPPSRRTKDGAR